MEEGIGKAEVLKEDTFISLFVSVNTYFSEGRHFVVVFVGSGTLLINEAAPPHEAHSVTHFMSDILCLTFYVNGSSSTSLLRSHCDPL